MHRLIARGAHGDRNAQEKRADERLCVCVCVRVIVLAFSLLLMGYGKLKP